MKKYLGVVFLVLGIGILIRVIYMNNVASQQVHVFSSYTLLTSSWEKYKIRFINNDGRVIDYSQGPNAITTSEGQSYAMLQAVWLDDKTTFDKVWNWTKNDLRRKNDNLLSWRWGKLSDNKFGVLPNGGDNSASDSDSDIALALVLASRRWGDPSYLDQAKPIISDIWKYETAIAGKKRYLIAGNWASSSDKVIINPSYFAPYSWRIFATIDKEDDWMSLVSTSYDLLNRVSTDNLDRGPAVGLPPDWIMIAKSNGDLMHTDVSGLTTNYGYDAMRVPWRIALDYLWNKNSEAKDYLNNLKYLDTVYSKDNKIPSSMAHDGSAINANESPSMYSTAMGYFVVSDPLMAKKIYDEKIIKLYSNDTNSFNDNLPYYEVNWLWFGSAIYNNYLSQFQ